MVQETEILSKKKQNELARLHPFFLDHVPDRIPNPLLFGSSNYTAIEEMKLENILRLKGQKVESVHPRGTTFTRQSILSFNYIQKRYKKIRSEKNFEERKRAGAVRRGSLGIVGNNLDKCNTILDKKTRAGLYRAQNMIQKIRLDGKPIVSETVCQCGKPIGAMVELKRNSEHGSSSVNSIATCNSVWACPVCRTKIISRRGEELKEIYEKWTEKGGHMFMLTLTVPHKKGDNLAELYGSNTEGTGISGALGKFRSSRDFSKDFKEAAGYFGDIRGVEVTWGRKNGFHPHIHMLILTDYTFDFKEWKMRFYKEWRRACLKSGLQEPSWEHGVDISYCKNDEQAQYLAKWSAASELVSDGMKEARHGNFSISELERCLWDKNYRDNRKIGLTKVASVLRSYYASMHGQRMLQMGGISSGNNWKKELLGTEKNEADTEYTHICFLKNRTYSKIKRAGKLPDLLQASEHGKDGNQQKNNVREWLRQNGYDESAMVNPYPPEPPPSIFGYPTGIEENKFIKEKIREGNKFWLSAGKA